MPPRELKLYPRCTVLLFFVLLLLLMTACNDSGTTEVIPPRVDNGVIDLRSWNFSSDGSLDVNGSWEFYWNHFLSPTETSNDRVPDTAIELNRYWNHTIIDGKPIEGRGFATYRCILLLNPEEHRLALSLKGVHMAYDLYANGKLLLSAGAAGTSLETSQAGYTTEPSGFAVPDDGRVELLIHVSNFQHRNGGIWDSLILGTEAEMQMAHKSALSQDVLLAGSMLVMALYHFIRYLLNRRDHSSLHFGVFALNIALRTIIINERFGYMMYPWIPWGVFHRLEYITLINALPLFMGYLRTLFPEEFHAASVWTARVLATLGVLTVIVVPSFIYSHIIVPFEILLLIFAVYSLIMMGLSVRRKRESSLLLLAGAIGLTAFILNDVLYANLIWNTGYLFSSGFIIFIVLQAYILARRSAMHHRMVEDQAIALLEEIRIKETLDSNLTQARGATILGLAKLAEYRDEDTGAHLERMREYSRILAVRLSTNSKFLGHITEEYVEDLYASSILHDIGKVGVPDSILLKPAALTAEEWIAMKKHAQYGGEALANLDAQVDVQSFLSLGKEIAYNHHEKWNGSGYPRGLKAEKIPLSARIVALADVYDALTSRRPYKKAFSHEKAKTIIVDGSGIHFDPEVVQAFIETEDRFNSIRDSMPDNG